MKKKPKNIPTYYDFSGTPIFRDTTALPFLDGGPLVDKTNHGKLLNSVYASALGNYYANGGMLKRADGSSSPRGLWDNIRENAGSGKKPTKQMLAQEKKINNSYENGGQFQGNYSLPEDSFKQGGNNLHNSVYASSPQQYPAVYNFGGTLKNNLATRQQMYMPLDHITRTGGSILSMSNTPQLEGEGKDLVYKAGGVIGNNPILPKPIDPKLQAFLSHSQQTREQSGLIPFQNFQQTIDLNTGTIKALYPSNTPEAPFIQESMNKEGFVAKPYTVQFEQADVSANKQKNKKLINLITEAQAIGKSVGKIPANFSETGLKNFKNVVEAEKREILEKQSAKQLAKDFQEGKISQDKFSSIWRDRNYSRFDDRWNPSEKELEQVQENWNAGNLTNPQNAIKIAEYVAAGAALTPAGLALLPAAAAVTAIPKVSAALNAYGLYSGATHALPAAFENFKEGELLKGAFNLGLGAVEILPGAHFLAKTARYLPKGLSNVQKGNAKFADLFKEEQLMQIQGKSDLKKFDQIQEARKLGLEKEFAEGHLKYYGPIDKEQFIYLGAKQEGGEAAMHVIKGTKASLADSKLKVFDTKKWEELAESATINRADIRKLSTEAHETVKNSENIIASGKTLTSAEQLAYNEAKSFTETGSEFLAKKSSIMRPAELEKAIEAGKFAHLNADELSLLKKVSEKNASYWNTSNRAKLIEQFKNTKHRMPTEDEIMKNLGVAEELAAADAAAVRKIVEDPKFFSEVEHFINNPSSAYFTTKSAEDIEALIEASIEFGRVPTTTLQIIRATHAAHLPAAAAGFLEEDSHTIVPIQEEYITNTEAEILSREDPNK